MPRERIIPLIVAVALFMEHMDATVISTALPAIADDIGADPLALKLAITSYLLSLAIFIPASGWIADRFGARTVFRMAIMVFMVGSVGCAVSGSLTDFVIARTVQGIGAAMMSPVGRIVLIRSVPKRDLVNAMAWVSIPALVGPMLGPPVGGFITTYFTWHWIFIINLPIGLAGMALATRYIEDFRAEALEPFDFRGMVLLSIGIAGVMVGVSVLGVGFLPWSTAAVLIAGGAVFIVAYVLYARRRPASVIDLTLLRLPTFRASLAGGFMFRLGVGALPFLLPLLLQLGFGMSPFHSGLVTFTGAAGAIAMKAVASPILRRFGFRSILVVNCLVSGSFLAACAAFTAATPVVVMVTVLLIGGFFRSLQFTCINAMAFADVESARVSRATSLTAAAQQLALSAGVAFGALTVQLVVHLRGSGSLMASDFAPAFLAVAAVSTLSLVIFARLPADAGAELSGRRISDA